MIHASFSMRPAARRLIRRIGLAACLSGLLAAPATAYGPRDLFIALSQPITPPKGFSDMCRTRPDLCTSQPDTAAAGITDDLRLLDRVNRTVNHVVRQQDDLRIYGRAEVWTPAGTRRGATGDCEDIALQKRAELLKAGFPAGNLFLAVGYARRIGLHVVLVARTGSGDLVLDSRAKDIRVWRDVPYSWVGAQSGEDPTQWFGIQA